MNLDDKNLEKALSNPEAGAAEQPAAPQMPKEMEIGFHQGALNTLVAERNELIVMVQNVEKIIGAHVQRLEQLGVKVQQKASEEKK